MKTDRELLELAAKAAGIQKPKCDGWEGIHEDGSYWWSADCEGKTSRRWNPLTDDGDALRLAVKLGICIGPESPDVIGKSLARASWLNHSKSLGEWGGGDQYSATRRAIVRAAADIGEAMP